MLEITLANSFYLQSIYDSDGGESLCWYWSLFSPVDPLFLERVSELVLATLVN